MADCGSYFRNYIQKKHTNMEREREKEEKKKKRE